MAIAEMKKLTLVGLKSDKEALVRELTRLGAVDVKEDASLQAELSSDVSERREDYRQEISELAMRQSRLADLVRTASDLLHQKKPMFTTRRIVQPEELAAAAMEQDSIMEQAAALEDGLRLREQLADRLNALNSQRQALEPWKDLVFPEEAFQTTSRLAMIVGTLPDEEALAEAREAMDSGLESYAIEIFLRSESGVAVAVLCLREERMLAERLLHQAHYAPFPSLEKARSGNFAAVYAKLVNGISEVIEQERVTGIRLAELAKAKADFELLHDYYQVRQMELGTALKLAESGHLFGLSGFVPASESKRVIAHLQSLFTIAAEAADPGGEGYPILLRNPAMVEPYESIVNTFSLPQPNNDPDPTAVMSIFYALSFGLMLSDVGYGLLLSIICGILVWKVKVEGNMRKMCLLFIQSGVVSMFFGLLFGGFFGNLITEVSRGRYSFPTVWFNPMDDPIRMMVASVLFGVLHIFAGMGLDMYKKIRNGQAYEAFTSVLPWYFIISGLGLMLLGVGIGQWLAIGGAAVILLLSSRKKNPLVRIFGGLGSLYGVTGYFSDLLSYTRILALTLCTSVIAMVVNMMAMLPGIRGINFIFFLLILLVGHGLNLALSGLSAYVHTTRLQYVEFFGKFYDGGGEAFDPLRIDTRFTRQKAAWDK